MDVTLVQRAQKGEREAYEQLARGASREWVASQVETGAASSPKLRLTADSIPRLVFIKDGALQNAFANGPDGGFVPGTTRIIATDASSPLPVLDPAGELRLVFEETAEPPAGDEPGGARFVAMPSPDSRYVFSSYGRAHAVDLTPPTTVHVLGAADSSYVYATSSGGPFSDVALHPYSEPIDGSAPRGALAADDEGNVHVLMETVADGWQLLYTVGSP